MRDGDITRRRQKSEEAKGRVRTPSIPVAKGTEKSGKSRRKKTRVDDKEAKKSEKDSESGQWSCFQRDKEKGWRSERRKTWRA